MKQMKMRTALIDSTIRVIAQDGLDRATTKAIATAAGVNEAYIYRLFDGKEDLLKNAFMDCNELLVAECSRSLLENEHLMPDIDAIYRNGFRRCWNMLLCSREKCLFYVRYYYSPYFQKYAQKDYQQSYDRLIAEIQRFFPAWVDVADLIHHALDIALCYAVKVFYGEMEADERLFERVYQLSKGWLDTYKSEEKQEVIQVCKSPIQ